MKLSDFLQTLRNQNIELRVDGDHLRCNAPLGALTPPLRDQLQERKSEILAFLRSTQTLAEQPRAIVPLQAQGKGIPIFAVPGHNGDVFCYRALAKYLGDEQPLFGLQPPGLEADSEPLTSIEHLAAYFAAQIIAFRPNEACVIAGYCAGGTIAFELARQLVEQGISVRFVVLLGSPFPGWYRFFPQLWLKMLVQWRRVGKHLRALLPLSAKECRHYLAERMVDRKPRQAQRRQIASDPALTRRARVEKMTLAAVRQYHPPHLAAHLLACLPNQTWAESFETWLRWPPAVADRLEEFYGSDDCSGDNILLEPHAAAVADLLRPYLDQQASGISSSNADCGRGHTVFLAQQASARETRPHACGRYLAPRR